MCTFVSLWFSCGDLRTGHGRVGLVIPGARLCAMYPLCEVLISRHPMWLPYNCYFCMREAMSRRRGNLLLQRMPLWLPGMLAPPAEAEEAEPPVEEDGPREGE